MVRVRQELLDSSRHLVRGSDWQSWPDRANGCDDLTEREGISSEGLLVVCGRGDEVTDELRDDDRHFDVRMKDGSIVSVDKAYADFFLLADVLENYPDAFAKLRESALSGAPYGVDRTRRDLRRVGLLDSSWNVTPVAASILRTSVVRSGEGLTVILPFSSDSEEQRAKLEKLNDWYAARDDMRSELIRRFLFPDDRGSSPGRE